MIMKEWRICAKDAIKTYTNCSLIDALFFFKQDYPNLIEDIFSIEGKN